MSAALGIAPAGALGFAAADLAPALAPRVLLVRLGRERFALPLGEVLEVMEAPALQPVALAPSGVVGQCLHRDRLVPVVDAATLLAAPRDGGAGVLLLLAQGEGRVALLVDDVVDMAPVHAGQWRPVPAMAGPAAALLDGVLDLEGRIAALVAMPALRAVVRALVRGAAAASAPAAPRRGVMAIQAMPEGR
ncbi:MAG: chemotaxis protein CheW [Gemmatimonadaceae bacterium]|nr:chemotaxis protein CheW [Gemmatimonadaceae bacterium]